MGSKGQSTQQTSQSQTYAPAGAGYIQNALQQAQSAAQTPFQQPVAPVAGFSPDQLAAFQSVNRAQGMAQPYINTAAGYFSPQGAQQFLNPYASNVMAGLKDIFGQQQAQTTGQLTQQAGGVGADRIAVGQANLAKQQDLAAGQTLSNIYGQAVQQAQSAGYGTAALGSQAQNAAISGAQAQLGTGGLQQQLQQAQLNAPYQNILARLAYPFQTAQFNAGITGALAPGLGGTTSGMGTTTTTPAQPSIWSQLLGAGAAGLGLAGGFGAFNSPAYGGGSPFSGDAWGGSAASPLPGLTAADYGPGYARGGDIGPYSFADGGDTEFDPYQLSGVSDKPISGGSQVVPAEQLTPIRPNIPQLNLNPPQQSGGSGGGKGGGLGDIIGSAAKIGAMFIKRGGAIPGYADGGGDSEAVDMTEPFRMPDQAAVDDWRRSVDADRAAGATASNTDMTPTRSLRATVDDSGAPNQAMAFTGTSAPPKVFPYVPPGGTANAPDASAAPGPYGDSTPRETPVPPPRDPGFVGSPWAALTAAGLGIMGGSSPFAGVNIGQGGMQGLKTLQTQREEARKDETVNQAAKRLQMEVDQHYDAMTKLSAAQRLPYEQMTLAQKEAADRAERAQQFEQGKPIKITDPLLGERAAVYTKDGWVYTDTGQKVVGANANQLPPESSSDDPARPFKNAQPSSATTMQAMERGLHGQAFLDAVPKQYRNDLEAVANYDAPITIFSKMGRAGMSQDRAFNLVRQMNPSYDAYFAAGHGASVKEFLAGGPNSPAAQIRSYNTAVGHAGEAWDALQEMKKIDPGFLQSAANAGIPFASYVAAQLHNKAIQGTPLGVALNKYNTAMTLYGSETSKLYSGSTGSQEERNTVRGPLDPAKSQPEIEEGLRTSARMMGSRGDALQSQYHNAMNAPGLAEYGTKGELKDFPVLNEKSKAALTKMNAITVRPGGGGGGAATVRQNGHTYQRQPDGSYKAID